MPSTSRSGSRTPIISTKATYYRKSLFGGRADLYSDRIVLSSISLKGRIKTSIPLDALSEVKADSAIGGKSIYLVFRTGDTIRLELARGAALWDLKIKECLGQALGVAELKESQPAPRETRRPQVVGTGLRVTG